MQAIILFMLKRLGTEVILQVLKQIVRILEGRLDNNITEDDVKAIDERISEAKKENVNTVLQMK